jgi:hypothetical protein
MLRLCFEMVTRKRSAIDLKQCPSRRSRLYETHIELALVEHRFAIRAIPSIGCPEAVWRRSFYSVRTGGRCLCRMVNVDRSTSRVSASW